MSDSTRASASEYSLLVLMTFGFMAVTQLWRRFHRILRGCRRTGRKRCHVL
jgi:hypothetical protein